LLFYPAVEKTPADFPMIYATHASKIRPSR
jgi:hypothetical protein